MPIIGQLEFDLGDGSPWSTPLLTACEGMVAQLDAEGRIDSLHLPLVAHLYGLCRSLEATTGRGASYAMLSQQFERTWERLASLPMPELADDEAVTYDVVLLPSLESPTEQAAHAG